MVPATKSRYKDDDDGELLCASSIMPHNRVVLIKVSLMNKCWYLRVREAFRLMLEKMNLPKKPESPR